MTRCLAGKQKDGCYLLNHLHIRGRRSGEAQIHPELLFVCTQDSSGRIRAVTLCIITQQQIQCS